MPDIKVDPRITIRTIPDGEIHIEFTYSPSDLILLASMFLAVDAGELKPSDARGVIRLRSKAGTDYMISELIKARKELFRDNGSA